jgi:hypothetical protein
MSSRDDVCHVNIYHIPLCFFSAIHMRERWFHCEAKGTQMHLRVQDDPTNRQNVSIHSFVRQEKHGRMDVISLRDAIMLGNDSWKDRSDDLSRGGCNSRALYPGRQPFAASSSRGVIPRRISPPPCLLSSCADATRHTNLCLS